MTHIFNYTIQQQATLHTRVGLLKLLKGINTAQAFHGLVNTELGGPFKGMFITGFLKDKNCGYGLDRRNWL